VVIDCGNVPAELMESELFGHRKGAFTGAVADREGAFEAAHGGTVFLDELGELPLELQPKLLRVLETGQVKRIGEVQLVPVDVRVVAATQRNLGEEVAQGRFRRDLYYRVAVVHIHLPPLRERREDIPLLADYLARQVSGKKLKRFPPEAEELLMHHDWPGNVRELRNVVHRTLALGIVGLGERPDQMHPAEQGPRMEVSEEDAPLLEFKQARERFEHEYLTDLWSRCQGNLSEGARLSGLDRKSLRNLLKKHGLYKGMP
jgi:DNA-binding NtrC family response regulator